MRTEQAMFKFHHFSRGAGLLPGLLLAATVAAWAQQTPLTWQTS